MPDHIDVKNKYSRGVNTVQHGGKNVDIKMSVTLPKFIMPPWMPSDIEPDLNIMSLNVKKQ